MLDFDLVHNLRQRVRKILEDDDGLGFGILELMLKFPRRIERIAVNHHVTCTQGPEKTDGILQDVGHHERDARANRETKRVLQVGGKIAREAI